MTEARCRHLLELHGVAVRCALPALADREWCGVHSPEAIERRTTRKQRIEAERDALDTLQQAREQLGTVCGELTQDEITAALNALAFDGDVDKFEVFAAWEQVQVATARLREARS